jgi:type I restriction enzyme M protein
MTNAPASSATIVQRVWNYCSVLRDDGVSYGDYLEQLTYLLFLKMDDERTRAGKTSTIPPDLAWSSLRNLEAEALERHYDHILSELGKGTSIVATIFRGAQRRIKDPAKLRRLVALIDGENWWGMDIEIKGVIYEGLLEKNAKDIKSGAGQYFTPRDLIMAVVDVIQPRPGETICDPACGTGGFLLLAHDYIAAHTRLDQAQWQHLNHEALVGWEIVDSAARLCMMNLYLHGIGVNGELKPPIHVDDSLASEPSDHYDVVLTNPPFGKKSSYTVLAEDGDVHRETMTIERPDFWATTSNKQLNFVQHVRSLLKITGRAAVVVPDNVLFEGGAGEIVRRKLLHDCDVHTLIRLPTGIFYAQGVKANILFFDRKPASETPSTSELWIYDFRTNIDFTLKQRPLVRTDLDEFVACYQAGKHHSLRAETWSPDNPQGRWRRFPYTELAARDKFNLDIFWLRDESLEDSANLPAPDVLAREVVEDLQSALDEFTAVWDDLDESRS